MVVFFTTWRHCRREKEEEDWRDNCTTERLCDLGRVGDSALWVYGCFS